MSIESKIKNRTITVQDIEPVLNTAGKIRAAGFVPFELKEIEDQIETIEYMWKGMEQALENFKGTKNYVRRMYRTRKLIYGFIKQEQEQKEEVTENE